MCALELSTSRGDDRLQPLLDRLLRVKAYDAVRDPLVPGELTDRRGVLLGLARQDAGYVAAFRPRQGRDPLEAPR